jgi:hypothetical protein
MTDMKKIIGPIFGVLAAICIVLVIADQVFRPHLSRYTPTGFYDEDQSALWTHAPRTEFGIYPMGEQYTRIGKYMIEWQSPFPVR